MECFHLCSVVPPHWWRHVPNAYTGKMKKKTISNAYQIAPRTVMVNKENYYQEYKGHTKLLSLISSHFAKNIFFGMTLLHAHAQCIYIVCAKYQKVSVKTLEQADFIVYALSYSILSTSKIKQEKKKIFFWHQTSARKCSMCLYYVGKVSNSFSKSCRTSWFPRICTIYA